MVIAATFNNTMADIIFELSEREIYNDIRSQIDVTEVETVLDAPTEYGEASLSTGGKLLYPQSVTKTLTAPTGTTKITWLRVECKAEIVVRGISEGACNILGGEYYGPYWPVGQSRCQIDLTGKVYAEIVERGNYYVKVKITNNWQSFLSSSVEAEYRVTVYYRHQTRDERTHEETRVRTLTVRAYDITSMRRYGRRVMNLVWPLGQTQAQMQSLINAYLERYKEPVPTITMTLLGKTDDLIAQILSRRVSDKVLIQSTLMNLNHEFFINSVEINHDTSGILEGRYLLELVRPMEASILFTLDTSLLDGTHILGW